MPGF
jgi:hypothetical protein